MITQASILKINNTVSTVVALHRSVPRSSLSIGAEISGLSIMVSVFTAAFKMCKS